MIGSELTAYFGGIYSDKEQLENQLGRTQNMTTLTLEQATTAIYQSLAADNEDIDLHIAGLKAAMATEGLTEFSADATKLPFNNRLGRKMMQGYFKKHGIKVVFSS